MTRVSYPEYIKDLGAEDLHNLIEHCQSKLAEFEELKKKEYLVVSDEWMNLGFFEKDNIEGALEFMCKEARDNSLIRNLDRIEIKVERWYEHDVADMIKENK